MKAQDFQPDPNIAYAEHYCICCNKFLINDDYEYFSHNLICKVCLEENREMPKSVNTISKQPKIKIKKPYGGRDAFTELYVNGVKLGTYIQGDTKFLKNPKKWAARQIKKRNAVLERNISRLTKELELLKKEKETINKVY